ncbi:MAG: zinc ribbon domain-containing protein [Thaumarchaeota archaeon]|nr:zinc ribbon domain-containing protein [Nitrososphaerota archaeon]
MAKYCIHCGKQNDDQAVFCTACGQPFGDQAVPAVQQIGASAPVPSLLTAEMGTGAHEHMLTDVYLKDSAGRVLLVARKQSLLHAEYTIVDGKESVTGFIEQKTHLTHRTLSVEDADHKVVGSVQISNVSENRAPPSCWLEDVGGNRLGTIVLINGMAAFGGVRLDGSPIFEASISAGPGVMGALTEWEHRTYAINLIDPGFPLPMLLTIITALDKV